MTENINPVKELIIVKTDSVKGAVAKAKPYILGTAIAITTGVAIGFAAVALLAPKSEEEDSETTEETDN